MGFKKILRKLACRPEKKEQQDEENTLSTELMETQRRERRSKFSSLNNYMSKDKDKPSKTKKESTKTKWDKRQSRYMRELEQRDPFSIEEVTGKYIDISASLTPKPKWWMTVMKLVIFAWVSFITADEFIQMEKKSFYLATFDHWSAVVSVVYLWFSVVTIACRSSSKLQEAKEEQAKSQEDKSEDSASAKKLPNIWHKIMWSLFSIAAPSQLFSDLAFWAFDFDGSDWDGSLISHGSVLLLLLGEGLCLNRTPMRINHQWFYLAFVFAFLLWSLIHSYLSIGNPRKPVGVHYLYSFLDWNQAPIATAFHVLLVQLLAAPFLYWIVWMMSLFSCPWKFQGKNRRYLNKEQSQEMESYLEEEQ